jgi:hypothetical protein
MNSVETNDQLEREIYLGEKSSKAYALWVMNYINHQQDVLFQEFKAAQFGSYNNIQARINAINELDRAIKQDMETGDLARKQLKGAVNE